MLEVIALNILNLDEKDYVQGKINIIKINKASIRARREAEHSLEEISDATETLIQALKKSKETNQALTLTVHHDEDNMEPRLKEFMSQIVKVTPMQNVNDLVKTLKNRKYTLPEDKITKEGHIKNMKLDGNHYQLYVPMTSVVGDNIQYIVDKTLVSINIVKA